MASLVCIASAEGTITRYEIGGEAIRKTHFAVCDPPVELSPAAVELFRIMPGAEFSIDPPPRPTGPPSGVGTTRVANAA